MTDSFMLMYDDLHGLQVLVHSIMSFPLLRTLSTLCYFPMVWQGRPPHPMKPKLVEFGQLRLGPKFFHAQLPRAHLAVVLFRTSVGSLLRIVQLLHQCYNLHILKSKMLTIYAGHIHYYATDMRRPHGVQLMACAWNR